MRIITLIVALSFVLGCQKSAPETEAAEPEAAKAEGTTPTNAQSQKIEEKDPAPAPQEKKPALVADNSKPGEEVEDGVPSKQGACGGNNGKFGENGTVQQGGNCGVAEDSNAPTAQEAKTGETKHFGGAFTLDESVSLGAVLADSAKYSGKTVKLRGHISKVCKKKGCWFTVTTKAEDTTFVRITMKDYGFFVPLDCDGKTAVIEGVFTEREVAESMRKHLAKDGGDDPSQVKGAKKEFTMVATAIDIEG